MIDFPKIHSFNHGQRHSFEELVCQLGRREHFPEHSVFKRVEGAGGDGGVEAYWTKPNGKKPDIKRNISFAAEMSIGIRSRNP